MPEVGIGPCRKQGRDLLWCIPGEPIPGCEVGPEVLEFVDGDGPQRALAEFPIPIRCADALTFERGPAPSVGAEIWIPEELHVRAPQSRKRYFRSCASLFSGKARNEAAVAQKMGRIGCNRCYRGSVGAGPRGESLRAILIVSGEDAPRAGVLLVNGSDTRHSRKSARPLACLEENIPEFCEGIRLSTARGARAGVEERLQAALVIFRWRGLEFSSMVWRRRRKAASSCSMLSRR